jgi:hypothetical protein
MDSLLRSALADQAASVETPPAAWQENSRRLRRDTRRRTAVASTFVVVLATTGVLGFTYLHEPGRGQPLPVQPLSTDEPVASTSP